MKIQPRLFFLLIDSRVYIASYRISLAAVLAALIGCATPVGTSKVAVEHSPADATYRIAGQLVTLANGYADTEAAPGSGSKIVTRIWGQPVQSDLNGDGVLDSVLILSQSTGGSGEFYYATGAIRQPDGYQGLDGIFLGDRIQPREISVDGNRITYHFADRAAGQSFADVPTEVKAQIAIYEKDVGTLVQVAMDVEGEPDPARMLLPMKKWFWVKTQYSNGSVILPNKHEAFSLTFTEGGRVQITTDCNGMRGEYQVEEEKIQFGQMMSTRKFCEDSQEQAFTKMLEEITSFMFTTKGQLVLLFKYDSGSMIFQ